VAPRAPHRRCNAGAFRTSLLRMRVGAARPNCSGPKVLDPDAFFSTIGVAS
jgi:hypothetical protein